MQKCPAFEIAPLPRGAAVGNAGDWGLCRGASVGVLGTTRFRGGWRGDGRVRSKYWGGRVCCREFRRVWDPGEGTEGVMAGSECQRQVRVARELRVLPPGLKDHRLLRGVGKKISDSPEWCSRL